MGHRSRKARSPQFVKVPNETVDHFEVRSPIALGLLTINLRHADGYPITLTRVQDRAKHGTRKSLAEARHILIDDGYAVFVKYNAQHSHGGRPQWESMTQYADTPHTLMELQELVDEHTPGRWLTLKDSPEHWRRVRVVSAQVTYWDGTRAIDRDGLLHEPKPARKPGYQSGTKPRHQQTRRADGKFGPAQ